MYQSGPIGGGLTVGGILAATGSNSVMTVIGVTLVSLFALLGGLLLLRSSARRRRDKDAALALAEAQATASGSRAG
ncbi:hypothetical protein [Leifsonia aquatica]|uniref:hypothetical protein n=1 Tax=Leifsonia aquatica TaxID=144185 RepID=UPI000469A7F7|nr:hypothetical protein [Leifsonia aquatica]